MLFDDEIKHLAHLSYKEQVENPVSEIVRLNNLEKDFENIENTEEYQRKIEGMSHTYAAQTKNYNEAILATGGRGSQVRVGRALRGKLVPLLALQLQEIHRRGMGQRSGRSHHLIMPLIERLNNDYYQIAHIALTCVMDSVGRGMGMDRTVASMNAEIGKRLDHEAFLAHIKETRPQDWERVDRWSLQSESRGYTHKVNKARGIINDPFAYDFMSEPDCQKVGAWCWVAIQSITGWFEQTRWFEQKGKKKTTTYYVGLSEEGVKVRDIIQRDKDEAAYEPWPMLVKPYRWEDDQRGGYLTQPSPKTSQLVHNNERGGDGLRTQPSETALAALHRAQEIPFRINHFIYEVQKSLLPKTEDIGSFRTYEADTYEVLNKPLIDPAVWDLPRVQTEDGKGIEHPERRKARIDLKKFYEGQKKEEKRRKTPRRVLSVAARFIHADRFYIPCYFDNRLRIYYSLDTITPNGSDWQKALIQFADGRPITDDNRAAVRRGLMITLANCWAKKENGIKTDKLSMDGRVAFAEDFIKELEVVARDPLCTAARSIWTDASEPFGFLACVREIFECFIWQTKTETHLPNGRDCTNSGMQILGSVCGDEKAMKYTNVIPSDVPQDLYGYVAEHAQLLLKSDVWVDRKIKKYLKQTKAKMKRYEKEGKVFKAPTLDFALTIDPAVVDRSVLKRAVMCTSYGASWQSKAEYIAEGLEEVFENTGIKPTLTDKRLVTDAAIEGLTMAFPKCDDLNRWFKKVGLAAMDLDLTHLSWQTPNGSIVVQEYRERLMKRVQTHAMGGGAYALATMNNRGETPEDRCKISIQSGWGGIKKSKHGTALGANFTHSLDACILQNTISQWDDSFYVVHDCFYTYADKADEMCSLFRDCFKDAVTAKPMHDLATRNGLDLSTVEDVVDDNTELLENIDQAIYMVS